jgi:ketosteroid isomerase-like protein
MAIPLQSDPEQIAARLQAAMNAHDLDALVACFARDYRSEQPAHTSRGFSGRDTVRRHWARFFDQVPDFRGDVVRSSHGFDAEWIEWRWHGTDRHGVAFDVRGVTIVAVREGRIVWARLYMEPVEGVSAEHTV